MTEKATKTQYRIQNWSKYNAALKQRGSLTFWLDDEVLVLWLNDEKTGKRGPPQPIASWRSALLVRGAQSRR